MTVHAEPPAHKGLDRVVVDPALRETVEAMRRVGIQLPHDPDTGASFSEPSAASGMRVSVIGPRVEPVDLDARAGKAVFESGTPIFAYDESIQKYAALEGTARFTAHALVTPTPTRYLPVIYLTAYFYTRSSKIADENPRLRYAEDANLAADQDYMRDRIAFMAENVPENCILFIDGGIIAGNAYTQFLTFLPKLHERGVIPVFVVKNSESSLVLDAVPEWRDSYNSDLHWAHRFLKPGQRSSLFRYQDVNPRNAKVFAYLRTFAHGPLRVELHDTTAEKHKNELAALFDLTYYLVLAQGDPSNPQPRVIGVAEMYAREALKMLDVHTLMRKARLAPTINQTRFGSS